MPINYKNYPKNWKEIRAKVLERAGNKCEFCGVKNYEHVQGKKRIYKVILTIAHLDHDPGNKNIKLDRLAALCQPCHLKYDSKNRGAKMNIELDKTEKQENGLTKEMVIQQIVESIEPHPINAGYCSVMCEHLADLGLCTLAGEEVLFNDNKEEWMERTKSCLVLKPIHSEEYKAITKQEENGAFRF
jgi:hypothetical protein